MMKIKCFLLISSLFVLSSFSQEISNNNIKSVYPAIQLSDGSIKINYSPFGFYLESKIPQLERIECEKSLEEVIGYLYFFLRSVKKRQELREKCSNYKLGRNYFASDYQKGSNTDLENILRYYFKQKNQKDLTIENYFQVIQKLKTYKTSIIREVLILHWHFYFNRLDNVRIHLRRMVSSDIAEYLIDLDYRVERKIVNDKDGKIRLTQILDELLTLANSRLESVIFATLVSYLSKFDWGEVSKDIQDKIQKSYSSLEKDDIRLYIKNFRWGQVLPNNWGEVVLKKLGEDELKQYLQNFWKIPDELKTENLGVPFLEFLFNPENRNSVLSKLREIRFSKNLKSKRYFYDLIGSSVLSGKRFKGEIILPAKSLQEKRKFYARQLIKKRWPVYSLYHLMAMGDLKKRYLNDI